MAEISRGPIIRTDPVRFAGRIDRFAKLAGGVGLGIGLMVLLGWLFDVPTLKGVFPGLVLMQPNTAASLGFAGLALLWALLEGQVRRSRRIGVSLAAIVALLGWLTLAEYVGRVDLGIDLLLFGRISAGDGAASPHRMALMTSICVACLGSALCLLDARTRVGQAAYQFFLLVVVLLAMLDLIGYAYGVRFLYMISAYSTMALHTAFTLLLLAMGALAARPRTRLMSRFLADDAGGWLLRNVMPLAVVLPVALGGLRVLGEESGLFNNRFGSALLVLSYVLMQVMVLWWTAGRLTGLDLDRLRAERLAQHREEWLQTTLMSIGDAVIATDEAGRVAFLNPSAERLTGWCPLEATGQPLENVFAIVNEATREKIPHRPPQALGEGRGDRRANPTLLISRDGQERPIDQSTAPILEGQVVVGSVLVFRDVSDRRRQEADLETRERHFRTLAESIPQLVWMAEPSGNIDWYNHRWYEYTGTTFEQMQGWGWRSVHDPDELPKVLERWGASIATGQPFEMVFPLKGADGIFRPFLTRVMSVKDDAGRVTRWFGTNTDITETKRAEDELRNARSRLDSTLAAAEVGTWEFDVTQNLVWADSNLVRMFGVTDEVANGGPLDAYLRVMHPEDRERVAGAIRRSIASDFAYEEEYRLVLPDGSTRWVVARGKVRRDELSQETRMPGVVVDITGRKQAEQEQRRLAEEAATSDAKFRTFFDQGAIFAAIMDPEGTILETNRLAWEAPGYLKEQIIGKPFWEGPWWARSDALIQEIKAASSRAASGQVYRAEVPYHVADGGERIFDLMIAPIKDEAGRVMFLAPTGTDVTERKRAEEALTRLTNEAEQQRRIYETALSNTPDFNYIFDLEGRFRYVNAALLNLWQKDLNQAVGKNYLELGYPAELADRLQEQILQVIQTRLPVRDETPLTSHLGVRQYEYILVPILTSEGIIEGVAGSTRDITERKEMERTLRQIAADLSDADHRKDEFLATLAHELRNPLAPIRNGLQIMKMAGNPQDFEESRNLMERQVTHMVRLIDDLMDISRITRGKMELRRERVDLATVIQNAVETSRPLMEAAGHKLKVTLPDRPILIDVDLTRVSQVFSNLLNNAAKYTEPGGEITLDGDRRGDKVVVSVRDNGIGIPTEMLPEVFAMFTQVDRSLERAQGGLGIGLSLVKTLVEMHGGSVEARSEGHGLGSEFLVRLPIAKARALTPVVAPPSVGSAGPPVSLRILVVDDNLDSARTLARLLKLLGHETRTANDGGQAVETAEAYRPDLIFLDIGLPVLNGYDVARSIRGRPWSQDLKIIALTGWGQDGDRRRSREAGIDNHLVKPVDPTILESLLADLRPSAANGPAGPP